MTATFQSERGCLDKLFDKFLGNIFARPESHLKGLLSLDECKGSIHISKGEFSAEPESFDERSLKIGEKKVR